MLRPTVSRPVWLGIKHPSETYDQNFFPVRQLRVCWCGALSLTRGRVCRLQLMLVLASAIILRPESRGTCGHILLSQIRDFPFRRLLWLAGLRWRYSTLPPRGRDPATLRTEHLNDPEIRRIVQEVEAGQRPEWNDITDPSPTYESYWAQWKSLAEINGILERNWESANGRSKIFQMCWPNYILDRQEVTCVSTKPQISFGNGTNGSRQEAVLRDVADCVRSAKQVAVPGLGIVAKRTSTVFGAPLGRIVIDAAGTFPRSDQGNRYLLIAMDYFTPSSIKRLRQWRKL
jgi:hypothetical protein